MFDNDLRLGYAVIAALLLFFAMLLGLLHYSHNVVPSRMAEKGLCWELHPGQTAGSYQPCAKR